MLLQDAVLIAKTYKEMRKEVRSVLIGELRTRFPKTYPYTDNEVRKLWQYPVDLSDDRLIKMLEKSDQLLAKFVELLP